MRAHRSHSRSISLTFPAHRKEGGGGCKKGIEEQWITPFSQCHARNQGVQTTVLSLLPKLSS